MLKLNYKTPLILFAVVVILSGGFYFVINKWEKLENTPQTTKFECPENYPDESEENKARDEWIDQYQLMNPYASTEDILRARVDFLIENSCREVLIKYSKYIRSDETAVEDIVQAYIAEVNNYTEKEQDYSESPSNQEF